MRSAFFMGTALAAIIGTATPAAAAGWEWAQFGMTRDEVVKASGGKAVPGMNGTLQLKEPFRFADFDFDALAFGFNDAGKLDTVTLSSEKQQFYLIEQALAAQFGQPLTETEGDYPARVFVDKTKGNAITLRYAKINGTTMITYKPVENRF